MDFLFLRCHLTGPLHLVGSWCWLAVVNSHETLENAPFLFHLTPPCGLGFSQRATRFQEGAFKEDTFQCMNLIKPVCIMLTDIPSAKAWHQAKLNIDLAEDYTGHELRRHRFIGGLKNNCLPQFTLYLYALIWEKWIQGNRIWRAKASKNRAPAGEQFQTDCMGSSEAKFHTVSPTFREEGHGTLRTKPVNFQQRSALPLKKGIQWYSSGQSSGKWDHC